MKSLSIIEIFPVISMIFMLSVGFFVLLRNKKIILNQLFFLISLVFSVWMLGTFMMFISGDNEKVIFWDRFIYLGVVFMPALQYHFSVIITNSNKKRKILVLWAYISSFFFLFISRSTLFLDGIFVYQWGVHSEAKILHHFFLGFFFFYVFALLYNLFKKHRETSSKVEKYRLIYLMISFSILNLVGGIAYLPAYKISIYSPVALIAPLIFSILVSYSIIKYRVFDIKFVLRQSSVYILSLAVIFGLTSIVKIIASKYLSEFVFWVDLTVVFFAVATFPYIKEKFAKFTNQYFFTSLYDSQKLILKTSNELKTVLNIEKVYDFLYEIFSDNLHTRAFGVLTYKDETKSYELQYNQGFKVKKGDNFDRNIVVEDNFIKKNRIVITEELKSLHYNDETKGLIDLLESLGVELLIPLKVKGYTIGLLVIGSKETEEVYNDEDLQVLEIIAGQAAVAIENAQLYSEVKKFNVRLKREVKKATGDVEKANDNLTSTNKKLSTAYKSLKQLDIAKNEFISIASHQLRTPLTSIKGFISLIRDGDYGKIDRGVDGALKKIFISNERLIKLVNDLLSLSRIESGKFTFHFEKNDIARMVKNIVDNFSLEAEDRGLKIKYVKPIKKIAPFVFDRDKIHESVSNIVDNAIKYTPEGKIEVKIENLKSKIRIIVSDSGKGMEREESKYVFEKFRRGVGSSSLNTEGTGLGLYVCKKIIDAHKGKVLAQSEGPGEGSQFIIELKKDFKPDNK